MEKYRRIEYKYLKKKKSLLVVNDIAERGIALAQTFKCFINNSGKPADPGINILKKKIKIVLRHFKFGKT